MAIHSSAKELRRMQPDELRKESEARRLSVAKARLAVALGAEKDTARFRRDKKELARMLTVLTQLQAEDHSGLKPATATSTVSAPARSRRAKQSSASQ